MSATLTERYQTYLAQVLAGLPAEMPLEEVKAKLIEELDAAVKADLEVTAERGVKEVHQAQEEVNAAVQGAVAQQEHSQLGQVRQTLFPS